MKRKILITGIAGSGKSTICEELSKLGQESHGIEDIKGMFAMYRKGTREIFDDYDNADPEKIKNSEWLCNINKLKQLLKKQIKNIAFYCGVASNMGDLIPLFDKVILLKVGADTLHSRLSTQEGTNNIGNTEDSRQTVLGWKDWWENEMVKKGAIAIDASNKPGEVAQKILTLFYSPIG